MIAGAAVEAVIIILVLARNRKSLVRRHRHN